MLLESAENSCFWFLHHHAKMVLGTPHDHRVFGGIDCLMVWRL